MRESDASCGVFSPDSPTPGDGGGDDIDGHLMEHSRFLSLPSSLPLSRARVRCLPKYTVRSLVCNAICCPPNSNFKRGRILIG